MRFSYSEFRKFHFAIQIVPAAVGLITMPIWFPLVIYLNRPQLPPGVEQEYMAKQRAAEMTTNSAPLVTPNPGLH